MIAGPLIRLFQSRLDLRAVMSVMSGNLATTLLSLISSIFIARWTEPEAMGRWSTALLFVLYLSQLQFGVFNGLNRQLPYYLGANQREVSESMAEVSLAWCRGLSLITCVVTIMVAMWFWYYGTLLQFQTAIAIGIILILFWPTQYLTVTYRTMSDFSRLARKSTLTALFGLALAGLVWLFGYAGLMLRAVCMAALALVALHHRRPIKVRPLWNGPILIQLARVGIPIWLAGQVGTVMLSLDRLVLTDSSRDLGLYYVATQVGILVTMIPSAFGMVLYPRMAHSYGETRSANDLWAIATKGVLLSLVISALTATAVWSVVPLFVELVLPAYAAGARAAQWASLLGIAMSLSIFNNIFNVIGRQDVYMMCAASGFIAFSAVWLLLTRYLGLPAIPSAAQSMLVAALASSALSAGLSKIACTRHDRSRNQVD